jgi:hypothetical protein
MVLNYKEYVFEAYYDYNKSIDYNVISTLKGLEFENTDLKTLNKNYTGWIIFEGLFGMEGVIFRISKWKSHSLFEYSAYIMFNHYSAVRGERWIYKPENIIQCLKVNINGYGNNRRMDEIDPYGEEDDW